MERIRERMAQEVGGYVSIFTVLCLYRNKRSNWIFENVVHGLLIAPNIA